MLTPSRKRERVVLIVSGGMDSCVLAYYYAAAGFDLHLLSFDYGQKHRKELLYAEKYIAQLQERYSHGERPLDIQHVVSALPIADLLIDSDCALINSQVKMPHGHYTDDSMKVTVVPYRNPNMLLQAATLAWGAQAHLIAYAAHRGDAAQYPDCREAFITAFNQMLALAMDGRIIKVESPFIHFSKAQIAQLGASLHVPFELTWSCYEGGHEGLGIQHCGLCGTCVERREAFELAGIADPTEYANAPK